MGIAVTLQIEFGVVEDFAQFGSAVVEQLGDDEEGRRGPGAQVGFGHGPGSGEKLLTPRALVLDLCFVALGIAARRLPPRVDGFEVVGGDVIRHDLRIPLRRDTEVRGG